MEKPNFAVITVLGGLISAALSFLPLLYPPLIVLSYCTSLPLFLLGLGMGLRSLLIGGGVATVSIIICQGPLIFFLLSFVGPVFFVHRALLCHKNASENEIWYPSSFLLRDITLFAGILMIFALGFYLYITQGNNSALIIKEGLNLFDPQGQLQGVEDLLLRLFPFLPGIFTFSWLLMMLFNASLAQGLLIRLKANLRPIPSFGTLQIPKSFLVALGLAFLLSIIGVGTLELLGKNAALILTFPFFLSGLGMVHFLLHKTAFAKIGLIIFYCALFVFLWPALFVVVMGMIRPWLQKFTMVN